MGVFFHRHSGSSTTCFMSTTRAEDRAYLCFHHQFTPDPGLPGIWMARGSEQVALGNTTPFHGPYSSEEIATSCYCLYCESPIRTRQRFYRPRQQKSEQSDSLSRATWSSSRQVATLRSSGGPHNRAFHNRTQIVVDQDRASYALVGNTCGQ